ncbi:MAG: DNA cytosine methyltransferase, partial [Patescibacteria group bacterium]
MYKFIDLFAGIGGFHLAFHRLGAECVFACEWDKHARKTYERNFKKMSPELFRKKKFYGDINSIKDIDTEISDFQILTAGFPCQPFSQAGFKKGFADTRGTLFFNIAEILRIKKPEAFFLENVRGLLNHNNGETFATIKKVIEEDLGYSFHWQIVRASDFGLPQLRPRLFMVGFKDKKIDFEFPTPIKTKMTMSDVWGGDCSRTIGFTLRCGGRGSRINDRRNWDAYLVDGKVKRLSPDEGKKMQGFPDNFVFPVSNVEAMKQLGNSVAVNAIQAVGAEIIKILDTSFNPTVQFNAHTSNISKMAVHARKLTPT